MKAFRQHICFLVCSVVLVLTGCEEKFDLTTLPKEDKAPRDTAYVPLFPSFQGFRNPQDVLVGNDQLLYVADSGRIVMMNLAGGNPIVRPMLNPISLSQDSRLDLLVGGEVLTSSGERAGALFRIHLVSTSPDSAHRLDLAPIDTVWVERAAPRRRFPGITVLPDNSWLAVRNGPDNGSPVDPDAGVLEFDRNDVFITPLPSFINGGQSPISINKLTGIASFPNAKDFVLIQSSEDVSYAALWMLYERKPDFEGWLTRYDPGNPTDFFRVGRYVSPEAVAIDKARRDIFIADAYLDSVFKFSSRGAFKVESFGRYKSIVGNDTTMQQPTGLAFFNKILYVADGKRGTVLRFTLRSDIPR